MIDPGAITINDILAVAAVLFGLSKIYDWIFEKLFRPKNMAEKRIKDLEDAQKAISEDVKDIHEYMYASLISIKALLRHGIDGNDIDSMREASKQIDKYLNEKIKV